MEEFTVAYGLGIGRIFEMITRLFAQNKIADGVNEILCCPEIVVIKYRFGSSG